MMDPGRLATLQERITEAKTRGRLAKFRYHVPRTVASGLRIAETFCKTCGTQITGFRPAMDPIRQATDDLAKTVLLIQPMMMGPLAGYVTVLLELDDGSKHATPLCQPCADTLTAEDLEAIYAADLASWLDSGAEGIELALRYAEREPVKILARRL